MYKFKHINIKWNESDLFISFNNKNQGYATEAFLVLRCISKELTIENIFTVGKDIDDGFIWKERFVANKIKSMQYVEFIDWLTNTAEKNTSIQSGDFNSNGLIGLEIRCVGTYDSWPSITGCKKIEYEIKNTF